MTGPDWGMGYGCLHSTDTETWACDCPQFDEAPPPGTLRRRP